MNHLWEHLLKQGILGTASGFSFPPTHESLQQLWQQLTSHSTEEQFLSTLAVLNQYLQNGRLPEKIETPASVDQAHEEFPLCNAVALSYLKTILRDSQQKSFLFQEWIRLAGQAKKRVPYELVPTLLNRGKNIPTIHAEISICVGQRGLWLASLNEEWQYLRAFSKGAFHKNSEASFVELDPKEWEERTVPERVAFLKYYRHFAPEKALNILQTSWKKDSATNRQIFLQVLHTQLSLKDEDFLESCLQDRSLQVRETALQLLTSSLEFRFSQKCLQFLAPYFSERTKSGGFKIKFPKSFEPEWEKMGLEEKIPKQGLPLLHVGKNMNTEGVWWLHQLLQTVKPSLLASHLQLSLESFFSMAQSSDSKSFLTESLLFSAKYHRDGDYIFAVLKHSPPKDFSYEQVELFENLAPEAIEKFLMHEFQHEKNKWLENSYYLAPFLRKNFPEGFSQTLSERFIQDVLPRILEQNKNSYSYYTREILKVFSELLEPMLYPQTEALLKKWEPSLNKNEKYDQESIDTFLNFYQFRYQIKKEFMV